MKTTLNRLPGFDRPTRRLEFAMFLSLGAVAAGLIAFAARDAASFAAAREGIVTAWESQASSSEFLLGGAPTNHAFTNLTLSPGIRNDRHG